MKERLLNGQDTTEKHKEIRNVEIKVLKVKEGESGATIPMDYYAKFNYFKECDVKEEGRKKYGFSLKNLYSTRFFKGKIHFCTRCCIKRYHHRESLYHQIIHG